MREIHVAKGFRLTLDDGNERIFVPGRQGVEPHIAEHWFVRAHLVDTPEPNAAPGSREDAEWQAMAQVEAEAKARDEAEARARNEADVQAAAKAALKAKTADAIAKQAENAVAQAEAETKGKKAEK